MAAAVFTGGVIGVAGVALGAALSLLPKRTSPSGIVLWIAFASGLMLAVSAVELLPGALALGGLWAMLPGFEAGVLTMALFMQAVRVAGVRSTWALSSILVGGAIAIHGLPEGMAIGAGMSARGAMPALMATMLLHGIPEGMAMAAPMKAAGISPRRVLGYTALAGVPVGIGAGLGHWLGSSSQWWIAFCLAYAGGAMTAVVLRDMLEHVRAQKSGLLMAALGAAAGALMSVIL